MKNKEIIHDRVIGTHYIVDLFGCNRQQINSVPFLKKTLSQSIKGTDIVLLDQAFYKFDPQGVTGFFLLSTSHISIHSWPEHGYLSVDVYSCSSDEMTRKVVDGVLEKIMHRTVIVKAIDRTYNLLPSGHQDPMVLELPVYKDGSKQTVRLTRRIESLKSDFQHIEIVDTEEFGRCMLIDNIVQTSEKDHHIYDQSLLRGLTPDQKEIIILGGGDGYIAEEALKINPSLRITIVDLDVQVLSLARKHLNQTIFDHPNVTVYIGDALQYMKIRSEEKVDGIISDLTDNPMVSLEDTYKNDYKRFFDQIVALAKKHLKPGGWLSLQAGTSLANKDYLNTSEIVEKIVKKHFNDVSRLDATIPSFGEENCFILAKKD